MRNTLDSVEEEVFKFGLSPAGKARNRALIARMQMGEEQQSTTSPSGIIQQPKESDIYADLVRRLTSAEQPRMSEGRVVIPQKTAPELAIRQLQADPEFHKLPRDYQNKAIEMKGGASALDLIANLQKIKETKEMRKLQMDDWLFKHDLTKAEKEDEDQRLPIEALSQWIKNKKARLNPNNQLEIEDTNELGESKFRPANPWEMEIGKKAWPALFGQEFPTNKGQQMALELSRRYPNQSNDAIERTVKTILSSQNDERIDMDDSRPLIPTSQAQSNGLDFSQGSKARDSLLSLLSTLMKKGERTADYIESIGTNIPNKLNQIHSKVGNYGLDFFGLPKVMDESYEAYTPEMVRAFKNREESGRYEEPLSNFLNK
jgi:hypothetical protein